MIYYSVAKKFVYVFVKNDKKRIIVECEHNKNKGCTWRVHASLTTHTATFTIKIFIGVDICSKEWALMDTKECQENG